MKCLETRETPEGFKRRRYESSTGQRFTTIEVPMEMWRRINTTGRQRNRAAQVQRTLDRDSRKRQAQALYVTGMPGREIARRLGMPESTVRRYLKTNP